MAINRLESEPDILYELKQLERCQREKKERQTVGADAVKVFKISTNSNWDYSQQLPTMPNGLQGKEFNVIFRSDKNVAGLSVHAKYEIVGAPNAQLSIHTIGQFVSDPKNQKFTVRVEYFGNEVIKIKFFVIATGRGSLNVI